MSKFWWLPWFSAQKQPLCTILHTTVRTSWCIFRAAAIGDEGIVVALLNAGADVTVKEETFGKTAELMADECAHMKIVELIQKATK